MRADEAGRRARRLTCKAIGHHRHTQKTRPDGFDHRGRWRTWEERSCKRCNSTDSAEIWRNGWLEHLRPSHMLWSLRGLRQKLREWQRTDCHDCGQASRRFGQAAGDHSECLPF
jgi:hypothetical protein